MSTEKIFSITGKEITKEKSCSKNDDGKVEGPEVSKISYKSGFHVFTILFGCGLAMSILTFIPRHDSIQEPEYWFEINFPAGFWIFFMTARLILDWLILMERDLKVPICLYLKVISATFLGWIMLFCIGCTLWMKILDYNAVMPWIGLLYGIPSSIVGILAIPTFAPYGCYEKQEFMRKSGYFVKYELLWIVIPIMKTILTKIFDKLRDTDAQCVIAVLIPVVKRCTNYVLSKVMKQMVGTENERANVSLVMTVNLTYGLWVTLSLIGARSTTMVCMVTVEFLMQMSMSYQVVKLHKKVTTLANNQAKKDKQKAVLKLLLAELSEGLVPLAYAIGFLMAYYGPNGHLIGNIRSDYWQYRPVDDVSWTLLVMFGLFSFDLICLSVNSSVLWVFSRVNLLDEFCTTMQKYWDVMAIIMINQIYFHFFMKDVNLAMDTTFKFEWIASNKNSSIFINSTDIQW